MNMNTILRCINGKYVEDHDLSQNSDEVSFDCFRAYCDAGVWKFTSDRSIVAGNEELTEGELKTGAVYIIDKAMRKAVLVLSSFPDAPAYYEPFDTISVGRSEDNDVVIPDNMVSSHHCTFSRIDEGWYIKDLRSSNGTIVGGKYISEQKVSEDDIITVGTVKFKIGSMFIILNYDEKIVVSLNEADILDMIEGGVFEYPFYTISPRMISNPGTLNINIESAPSIGEKPTVGVGGIPLSLSMIAVSVGMQALRYSLGKRKYTKLQKQRAELYANYLAGQEAVILEHIKKQKTYAKKIYPYSDSCLARANVSSSNLWERRPDDEDFLCFTLGEGTVAADVSITIPQQRLQMQKDDFDDVPAQIVEKYKNVSEMPITCFSGNGENIGIVGTRKDIIDVAYNYIIQLAALHSYEDVKLVVLFPEKEREYWEWVRFLPHCNSDSGLRYVACTRKHTAPIFEEIGAVLKNRVDNASRWSFGAMTSQLPYYIFLIADFELVYGSQIGDILLSGNPDYRASCVYLSDSVYSLPHNVKNIVNVSGNEKTLSGNLKTEAVTTVFGNMKRFNVNECDCFARKLAPIRLRRADSADEKTLPTMISFLDGINVKTVDELDIQQYWARSHSEDSLAVPIGVKANGESFIFDIHQKVHGPHGLVAGGTGSGKSQMAQTWILSLALHFSPSDVNFILVDFKGESLLQPFEKLPHVAGRISNLDKDVSRSFSALESELVARQKRLAENECKDIIEYQKRSRYDDTMEKMPYIILVIDEYAELKQQFPDFAKSLDHLFRGGRSLGMLVVLMTQQPAGIITDQMRANSNFSWCLSVRDESDSRAILGIGDAAMIKNPGRAYIKCGDGTFELIQSFYCGARYTEEADVKKGEPTVYIVALNGERTLVSIDSGRKEDGITEIGAIVERISAYCEDTGKHAKPLWAPELPETIDLGDTISLLRENMTSSMSGVAGLADDPANQRNYYITHNFETDGNLAVYGMPLSGKTTFLISLIESFCLSFTPDKIWFYIIECGGYRMRALQCMPHIGAAVGDDEPDTAGRILSFLSEELESRKKRFHKSAAGTFASYNEMSEKSLPQIVLAIDNLNLFMRNFPDFSGVIIQLSQQGSAYGINLICSFSGTSGVNYQLLQNIKTVFSLELADKIDYQSIVGRPTVKAPRGVPGRGFIKNGASPLLFQTAILAPEMSDAERDMYLKECALKITNSYSGETPVKIVSLPETIRYDMIDLPENCVTFGLCTEDTKPVSIRYDKILSLIISYTDRETQLSVLNSIIRQFKRDSDANVTLYTSGSDDFTEMEDGLVNVETISVLDEQIESIAVKLRERQAILKNEPGRKFPYKIIVLDNYAEMITSIQPNTAARLEVFIRLGKGLGLCIIAADTAEKMNSCGYSSNILTATLKQGAKLLIGGRLSSHQIADTFGIKDAHTKEFKNDEGMLTYGGKNKIVKLILS